MKQRLIYFCKYYVFWLAVMLLQKPLFMLSQHTQLGDVQALDWLRVMGHAFPLDLSVASYIMVLFGLLLVVSFFAPARIIARISDIYTYVILLITVAVFGTDIGVFPAWGFHPDKTLFIYLASPKEVLACAPWYVWVFGIAAMILVWALLCLAYRRWMNGLDEIPTQDTWPKRCGYAFAMLFITGALFLPIRGSLSTSTMNTGRVYFSENQLLNQSAVNPIFNIIESMGVQPFDTQRYTYMPTEEAERLVAELLPPTATPQQVLTTSRPNIIFFILESFSQNAWDAMPCLRQLAEEGIYFSQVAASSFRTDRGVVAALSGFPGQPTSSLMVVPGKTKNLPQLGKSLLAEGYQLKFWYGGDEDFTSMRSYLIDGGFVQRVSDHSFPVSQRLSKWGVPDHVLLPLAADEIAHRNSPSPTLDVILTLSSHEPFEVPTTDRFHDPYLNSIAYTDSCLGAFVDTLRRSPQWSNTLLVFMADHGYPYPYDVQNHEPRRYAIPVIWAGGAVAAHREIKTLCSQIDIAPTILSQMDIDRSAYWFGKDILDSTAVPFAFYSFNDGFALLTPQDTVVIDAKANTCIIGQEGETETRARAFMQRVMETIDSRL
jgi:phosphoglycerol transferase MdoB-like AlkP superfamily enzyme